MVLIVQPIFSEEDTPNNCKFNMLSIFLQSFQSCTSLYLCILFRMFLQSFLFQEHFLINLTAATLSSLPQLLLLISVYRAHSVLYWVAVTGPPLTVCTCTTTRSNNTIQRIEDSTLFKRICFLCWCQRRKM